MKPFQTPNCHSRKCSVRRQPLTMINNCPEFSLCADYLQNKVQGLEMRVKNLNSHHADDNRSTTASKTTLSPFNKYPKKYDSNKQIDTQSYYEQVINQRLENISKVEHSPARTEHSQDKYSVHSQINNYITQPKLNCNSVTRIQLLTKKLRKFKMVKDQNQEECAPSLAKIKCFCQEYQNDCFDFYRCTDLITLKYLIYLLLQEVNQLCNEGNLSDDRVHQYEQTIGMLKKQIDTQNFDKMTFQGQLKLQQMVVDTQHLIQEIVNSLSNKQNQVTLTNQIENLSSQIKTLRENMNNQQFTNSFGQRLADYETNETINNEDRFYTQISSKSKSPCYRVKYPKFDTESHQNIRQLEEQTFINRQLMEKIFEMQSRQNQERDLEEQIQNKNYLIEDINKKLNEVIQKNQELVKENEFQKNKIDNFRQIEQKYLDISNQQIQQNQQFNLLVNENIQLKKSLQKIETECKQYEQQMSNIQEKYEIQSKKSIEQRELLTQQIQSLDCHNSEQNKIIKLITDEAIYLGQMTLNFSDIIIKQQADSLPTPLIMVQKDLINKRQVIIQKIRSLQQFGDNLRMKQFSEVNLLENVEQVSINSTQTNQDEMITMLIMQCNTIERLIDI